MKSNKEQIKELKSQIQDLKYKLEYTREVRDAYKTFWLDTKEMYKNN